MIKHFVARQRPCIRTSGSNIMNVCLKKDRWILGLCSALTRVVSHHHRILHFTTKMQMCWMKITSPPDQCKFCSTRETWNRYWTLSKTCRNLSTDKCNYSGMKSTKGKQPLAAKVREEISSLPDEWMIDPVIRKITYETLTERCHHWWHQTWFGDFAAIQRNRRCQRLKSQYC